jgi:hypothetical protein
MANEIISRNLSIFARNYGPLSASFFNRHIRGRRSSHGCLVNVADARFLALAEKDHSMLFHLKRDGTLTATMSWNKYPEPTETRENGN